MDETLAARRTKLKHHAETSGSHEFISPLQQASDDILAIEEGSALHKMEDEGWMAQQQVMTEGRTNVWRLPTL